MKLVSSFSLAFWIVIAAACLFGGHYVNGWGEHCEYGNIACD